MKARAIQREETNIWDTDTVHYLNVFGKVKSKAGAHRGYKVEAHRNFKQNAHAHSN